MSGIVIQAENLGKHYPTGHQAENGRAVACALEDVRFEIRRGETVGTGSHPKLTGREHIYQNDAILGMKRAEVKRKYVQMAFSAPLFTPEFKS